MGGLSTGLKITGLALGGLGGAAALGAFKMLKNVAGQAITPAPYTKTPFGYGGSGMPVPANYAGGGMYGGMGVGGMMGGYGGMMPGMMGGMMPGMMGGMPMGVGGNMPAYAPVAGPMGGGFAPGSVYTNYSPNSPFGKDIWAKGPFGIDIRMRNPIDALFQKLTGAAYARADKQYMKEMGGSRSVAGYGPMNMPGMMARAPMYSGVMPMGGGMMMNPMMGGAMMGGPVMAGPMMGGPVMAGPMMGGPMAGAYGAAPMPALGMVDTGLMSEHIAGAAMPQLAQTSMEIDSILARVRNGGKLDETQTILLQDAMQRRAMLFQLMTNVMQMENDTRRNTIGKIG